MPATSPALSPEPCPRRDGSLRAFFDTREAAEAFANNPENWPTYQSDIAHKCTHCPFFHLSKFEWLFPEWEEKNNFRC
jgi:hypothetical protein